MRITCYEVMLSEDGRTTLVKEKAVNYDAGKLNSPQEVGRMMRTLLLMDRMAVERCYMIALNNACRVTGLFLLSKGTVDASFISPRECYIRALLAGAVQIILCHNHPSGETVPSREDKEITERMKEAGDLLRIRLADHIIIGGDDYYSFRERGLL